MDDLEKSEATSKKVLVVEDSLILSQALTFGLKKAGFDVYTASNGEEGLKMIMEILPRVVLLDIMMPVMDGIEVLEKIQTFKKKNNISIFMLTNFSAEENIDKCFSLGADDYLVKANFTIADIVEKINKLF